MSTKHARPPALIELQGVSRIYSTGGTEVQALRGVNLTIQAGEMVAIMGASGSGKSTLMNLLGCLDVPSQGILRVDGVDVNTLGLDELARLRRERFGFIFQRYHLIKEQSALANVTMPAIYAGMPMVQRSARGRNLLSRLGLAERLTHRPNELSGGQQQRVSIARALMNGGEIILADEPTGALDSRSGRDMLALLLELHQQGHTVLLVTHDTSVAAHAPRVIELEDGKVLRDTGWPKGRQRAVLKDKPTTTNSFNGRAIQPANQLRDAVAMAWVALSRHRLRTLLSTLGIAVGIAAVVAVMALGQAMRTSLEATMRGFLSNKLMVSSGNPNLGPGIAPKTFTEDDVLALRDLTVVQSVRPKYEIYVIARQGNRSDNMAVIGLAPEDMALEGYTVQEGRSLNALDVQTRNQVIVLNPNAVSQFFSDGRNPLGQTIVLGDLPFEVVGVSSKASSNNASANWQATGFVPDMTLITKMLGHKDVSQLYVYMKPQTNPRTVQVEVTQMLTRRHGTQDFTVFNQEEQFRQVGNATHMMTLVLAAIASISLLVGGVGVMNMMLVAVTERTAEIGIRMAVGARPSDVQMQFLIEAIVLCGVGGMLGLLLSWGVIGGMNIFKPDLQAHISVSGIGLAFAVSTVMGLGFGFMPARQAARLSPVAALARE